MLKSLALDMARLAAKRGADALFGGGSGGGGSGGSGGLLGGLLGSLVGSLIPSARGNVFAGGRSITAFARGGALTNRILRRPTLFPLADGIGLAGEAGPEAILPPTMIVAAAA